MSIRLRAWDTLCDLLFASDKSAEPRRSSFGDTQFETELVSFANASFVTAALWVAILRRGLAGELSEAIKDYLAAFYTMNSGRNDRIHQQLFECIRALNGVGVTPMPLKGAAYLLSELYSDSGERFLADIDLLIPTEKAPDANAALAKIGFRAAPRERDLPQHHHLPTLVRSLDDVAVELHTAPVATCAQAGLSVDEIWAGSNTISQGGHQWCGATPTDTVMLSFLHGEIVDRYLARCIVDLRGYLDLHRLLHRSGSRIDWRRNLVRADQCEAESVFRRYLYVFRYLTGESVPALDRIRWRDRMYISVTRSAVRWTVLARAIKSLSADRIMKRYSISANPIVLNAYRIRAVGGMIRNRLFGRPDKSPKRLGND